MTPNFAIVDLLSKLGDDERISVHRLVHVYVCDMLLTFETRAHEKQLGSKIETTFCTF